MKHAIHSMKFTTDDDDDDDVTCAVRTQLYEQDKVWSRQDIHTLAPHWCKATEVDEDFVET
jgi:hypothetical protein